MSDRRMAEDRLMQAELHLAKYGERHSLTSCPPNTRAMCSFADVLGPDGQLPQRGEGDDTSRGLSGDSQEA